MPPLRDARRRHAQPGAGRRALRGEPAVLRRAVDLGREPEDRREAPRGGRAVPRGALRPQLHALLAAQDAGDLPRDDAVVRGHGRGAGIRRPEAAGDAARNRAARRRGDGVLPGLGQGAAARHDREPARLDALAPAAVGRADAVLHPQGDGRAAPALARAARAGRAAGRARRDRGVAAHRAGGAARRRRRRVREGQGHARRLVRFRLDAPDGDGRPGRAQAAHRLALRRDASSRPTSISRARTSIAAGSTRRCWSRAC